MLRNFLEAIQHRRTYYSIDHQITITPNQVETIVKTAVLHTPSAFNSQSARVLLLWGKHHTRLWEIVATTLRTKIGANRFAKTEEKLIRFPRVMAHYFILKT